MDRHQLADAQLTTQHVPDNPAAGLKTSAS